MGALCLKNEQVPKVFFFGKIFSKFLFVFLKVHPNIDYNLPETVQRVLEIFSKDLRILLKIHVQ